jgi:predicted transcriptional regulator
MRGAGRARSSRRERHADGSRIATILEENLDPAPRTLRDIVETIECVEGELMAAMTKLLEKAIEKVRQLSPEDQDVVAAAVLSMTEEIPLGELDDDTREAIREGLEQARRGEFVPDEEIEAIWKRHGL